MHLHREKKKKGGTRPTMAIYQKLVDIKVRPPEGQSGFTLDSKSEVETLINK